MTGPYADPSNPQTEEVFAQLAQAMGENAALRAERDAARAEVLPRQVERGAECFHGTPGACLSLRCGSNCSHRFDRMHPCPACLVAQVHAARAEAARLRAAVEGVVQDVRAQRGGHIASLVEDSFAAHFARVDALAATEDQS